MKSLAVVCILVFGPVSALACPSLQGEWQCTDSSGDKWTESIAQEGNKFVAIIDKGTKNETKEELIADGAARETSSGIAEQTRDAVGRALDKLATLLPQSVQSAIVTAKLFLAPSAGQSKLITAKMAFSCEGNTLKGAGQFQVSFNVPLLLNIEGSGTVDSTDTLVSDTIRELKSSVKGSAKASAASLGMFSSIEPQTAALDEPPLSAHCTRQ